VPSVPLALFADYAAASEWRADKLHVIGGGIRSLSFVAFPATWPRLSLALGLEFTAEESSSLQHTIRIDAKGPSDAPLLRPHLAAFGVRPNPTHANEPVHFHFVYNMENITFPIDGDYVFSITVDDQRVTEIPLRVLKVPGPVPREVAASMKLSDGYEAFNRGDIDNAQRIFQEVVAEFPEAANGHNNLGFVLLGKGEAAAALAAFTKARELKYPGEGLLDANMACAHYLMGEAVAAKILFQQCLRTRGFENQGILYGINGSELVVVGLNSASDYVALMMLNAAWCELATGNRIEAESYLAGAQAADLRHRESAGGKNFALSIESLKAKLANPEASPGGPRSRSSGPDA
jgi:tetratricopeptide (TPR) repeat protein